MYFKNDYIKFDYIYYIMDNISIKELITAGDTIALMDCDDEKHAGGLYDLALRYAEYDGGFESEEAKMLLYYNLTHIYDVFKAAAKGDIHIQEVNASEAAPTNINKVIRDVMDNNSFNFLSLKIGAGQFINEDSLSLMIGDKVIYKLAAHDSGVMSDLLILFKVLIFKI